MSKIKSIRFPIEQELQDFEPYFKKSLKSDVPLLGTILNFLYRTKGKQLRPMFVFLSAKLHGETNEFSQLAACSVELLHSATLVHDDVVDESYERRGMFSINALWRNKLAVLVGVAIGMVMGFSRLMRDALYPLLVGFNAIPKATVVPIVALLFIGQHDFNTVLIAFMISFFPIAVSVSIGLSTLEPEYRDILRSLGASRTTIFWKIALPKTLPEFFGALKVAVTLAFIGTNLMEIVSPHGRGLGALFDSAKTNSDYPLMFAVLIALAALGILLYYVVVMLEKIFAGWAERDHQ